MDLESIDVSHCVNVTDSGITRLIEGLAITKAMQVLKLEGCVRVSDAGVLRAARAWPRLRELHLAGLPRLTPAVLEGLFACAERLEVLDMAGVATIHDLEQNDRSDCRGLVGLRQFSLQGVAGLLDFDVQVRGSGVAVEWQWSGSGVEE